MSAQERFDLGKNAVLCHEAILSRVITRTSIPDRGDYTKLRELSRAPIMTGMAVPTINIEKLKADMAQRVAETSGRNFSLAATDGKNPDFYRNFINNGQDKRMSADVFVGIVHALGADLTEYLIGIDASPRLSSEVVLQSTFAALLDSLGIDPNEGGRAQMLASLFPGTLQRFAELHATTAEEAGSVAEEGTLAGAVNRQ